MALRIFLLGTLLASMAACSTSVDMSGGGDGGGTASAFCNTLDGPGASVRANADPGCVDCNVQNPQNVSDDSATSYATIVVTGGVPMQGALVAAMAPDGVSYPAGGHAGAFLRVLRGGTTVDTAGGVTGDLAIRTYLDGELQETAGDTVANSLNTQEFPGGDDLPHEFVYFVTALPYDSVEIFVTGEGVTVDGAEYRIHALCSDGNVDL